MFQRNETTTASSAIQTATEQRMFANIQLEMKLTFQLLFDDFESGSKCTTDIKWA